MTYTWVSTLQRWLTEPEPAEEERPRLSERYELIREVGRGGMATVYEAQDRVLHRRVALKVIQTPRLAPEAVGRFDREARIIAGLRHPNIVTLFDVGRALDSTGTPVQYLAMEFIDGPTLGHIFWHDLWPRERRVGALIRIAEAAHHAHERGVIHRDLKPDNVLIRRSGEVVLTDFGVARVRDAAIPLTSTRTIIGTPHYMAPEQIEARNDDVTARTDVYALGVVLYEALTGHPPFNAGSQAELFKNILMDEPIPPRRLAPSVPRDLQAITLKALAKAPRNRYASAKAFADDLNAALSGGPVEARDPSWLERVRRRAARHPVAWSFGAAMSVVAVVAASFAVHEFVQSEINLRRRLEAEQSARAEAERRGDWERAMRGLAQLDRDMKRRTDADGIDARIRRLDEMAGDAQRAGDEAGAWFLLGEVHRRRYRPDGAIEAYTRALERPESAWERQEFIHSRARLGRALACIDQFQDLLVGTAEDEAIRVAASTGLLRQVNADLGGVGEGDGRLLLQAWAAYVAYDFKLADRLASGRIAGGGEIEEFLHLRGMCRAGEEAVADFDEVLRRDASRARTWFHRGVQLDALNRDADAVESYDRAVELQPHGANAYNNRGCILMSAERAEEAVADLRRACEFGPGSPQNFANLAGALTASGRAAEAVEVCSGMLGRFPDHRGGLMRRGEAHMELGAFDAAAEDFGRAIVVGPANGDGYVALSHTHHRAGNRRLARANLEAALACGPNSVHAWTRLCKAASEQGVWAVAAQGADAMVAGWPEATGGSIRVSRAVAWFNAGDLDRAESALTEAGSNVDEEEALAAAVLSDLIRSIRAGPSVRPTVEVAPGSATDARLDRNDPAYPGGRRVALHALRGAAGGAVTIHVDSDEFNPVVVVRFPDGTCRVNEDRSGSDLNSTLTVERVADGDCAVEVTSTDPTAVGAYRLVILPAGEEE